MQNESKMGSLKMIPYYSINFKFILSQIKMILVIDLSIKKQNNISIFALLFALGNLSPKKCRPSFTPENGQSVQYPSIIRVLFNPENIN
jgi:hypothetical protein